MAPDDEFSKLIPLEIESEEAHFSIEEEEELPDLDDHFDEPIEMSSENFSENLDEETLNSNLDQDSYNTTPSIENHEDFESLPSENPQEFLVLEPSKNQPIEETKKSKSLRYSVLLTGFRTTKDKSLFLNLCTEIKINLPHQDLESQIEKNRVFLPYLTEGQCIALIQNLQPKTEIEFIFS